MTPAPTREQGTGITRPPVLTGKDREKELSVRHSSRCCSSDKGFNSNLLYQISPRTYDQGTRRRDWPGCRSGERWRTTRDVGEMDESGVGTGRGNGRRTAVGWRRFNPLVALYQRDLGLGESSTFRTPSPLRSDDVQQTQALTLCPPLFCKTRRTLRKEDGDLNPLSSNWR